MKISYEWLQSYFDARLPKPEELAEVLTFHAFEIEGVAQVGKDTVIDIDVLPNRSSDCLSHRGIAREIVTLLEFPLKDDPLLKQTTNTPDSNILEVDIKNSELVNRFSAAVISGVEVGESPKWLRERLEAIGQKSINSVVDATNYVMFDLGQPLHAFDRDKMTEKDGGYAISVRTGKGGENITTLSDEDLEVGGSNLLIVDGNNDKPIGIAGVKGGKGTDVTDETKNLVIEAANFNYVSVRKTSQQLKLSTDASTRFQNQPSPELTLHALREVVGLIGGTLEGFVDYYPEPQKQKSVSVTVSDINGLLGTTISADEVESILKRFDFDYSCDGETYTVTPPFERTDLIIKEDLIEEAGRVYGYDHVEARALPEPSEKPAISKRFYYAEKVRKVLVENSFSEVYTYALQPKGEVELANALAKDKPYLRSNISDGIRESSELNGRNADILGLEQVRIFEIGTVFRKDSEHISLALSVRNAKKLKQSEQESISEVQTALGKELGTTCSGDVNDGVLEINFTELLEKLPEPKSYDISYDFAEVKEKKFEPISPYPFVLRDIAVWVPKGTDSIDIFESIQKEAGELLANHSLFDTFEKNGKVSYAFHLVFQHSGKTLSDDEVNKVMEKVTAALSERGWEVR